ncbi:M14 family zinc carboxypeptidase [Bacillus sp. 31A1R]|uniref:M14 family zinc carboxypeptidase n=2 Tax=Robertmurraya mangrovi TaxID=3098077 RepID=A0ABU5J3K3_9BACI|nr:M14 family zinc carboxypeptidase [Bacillus sp. 31A1R]
MTLVIILTFPSISLADKKDIVDPTVIYTYKKLEEDIRAIQKKYHKNLEVKVIGKSHFGRKIYAAKLGKGKKSIFLIGSHHGREWLTTTLIMKMLEEYTKSYSKGKDYGEYSTSILDEVSIWFIPMLNPDGVTIQQGFIEEFPKYYQLRLLMINQFKEDFSRWKANGKGIDLNRQYPAGWDQLNEKPAFPSYQFYKGRKPVQAREVKIMTDFTKEKKPLLAVAYHSSGREIYWEYKNGKHLDRDYIFAKKTSNLTGYRLAKPSKKASGGGYTDWFITNFHRPALTIEICPIVKETNPPLLTFQEEWSRNKFVGIMLARESKRIIERK